ncbi:MAG TPA: FAD-dependent oxidoreductase [Thermoanaerobaculia bacterium]|nr:FAD-dependent oxidoreductase [Thermoanaerobaculia bacterium]
MSRILILGAGPAGLAAAYRLKELGHDDFEVLEARATPGGLASSETSRNGFVYDIGGHVLFSHFRYFDELFDRMLGDGYQELERESWIWIMDRFLPYPFQNNIKYLPKEAVLECVLGLIEANRAGQSPYDNFEDLIHGVFGAGIAKHFMMPYNFKVWAHPPRMLGTRWIGERVPVVDIERVLGNVILDRDDVSWGPNNTFKYPLHGGTGGLFTRIAATLRGKIRYGASVISIDARRKRVTLDTGKEVDYDELVSTIPLDRLVEGIAEAPPEVRRATGDLLHSGSAIVGVGVRQPCPSKKCWMYFPESSSPFYRVTYLSNYSPEVVPDASTHYSLLAEVSRSPYKPVNLDTVVDEVIDGMVASRLLSPADRRDIVDTHLIVRDYTYPIPSLDRDAGLSVIQPWLEARNIHSRGRFGAWKYEIGNMDHAVQMGAECVDRILLGTRELCWNDEILPKDEQTLRLMPEAAASAVVADVAQEDFVGATSEA